LEGKPLLAQVLLWALSIGEGVVFVIVLNQIYDYGSSLSLHLLALIV
jgi:hypothetical protein